MKLIVAVDRNWGIGWKGKLLAVIPADMQYFRNKTWGKVIVMGRRTFESLPGKQPLPGRTTIVLTANEKSYRHEVIPCCSLDHLFSALSHYAANDIFIIGGQRVYEQCMPYCSEAYVTKIGTAQQADTFFPNLDSRGDWECIEDEPWQLFQEIPFKFTVYRNIKPRIWAKVVLGKPLC